MYLLGHLVLILSTLIIWRTNSGALALRGTKNYAPRTPMTIPELVLPNGMVIMRRRVTQAEAMDLCETLKQGRLAVLLTSKDADELIYSIKDVSSPFTDEDTEKSLEFGMSRKYWIGLTDVVVEGRWTWINDGSVLSYNDKWLYGQPDHLNAGSKRSEHCVSLWNPFYDNHNVHSFSDESCMEKHYFICELKRKGKTGNKKSFII